MEIEIGKEGWSVANSRQEEIQNNIWDLDSEDDSTVWKDLLKIQGYLFAREDNGCRWWQRNRFLA